jgi:hypothetical protein
MIYIRLRRATEDCIGFNVGNQRIRSCTLRESLYYGPSGSIASEGYTLSENELRNTWHKLRPFTESDGGYLSVLWANNMRQPEIEWSEYDPNGLIRIGGVHTFR